MDKSIVFNSRSMAIFHIKSAAYGPVLIGEYIALKLLICHAEPQQVWQSCQQMKKRRPLYCPTIQSTGKTKCTISPHIGLSYVLIPCLNVYGSGWSDCKFSSVCRPDMVIT